MTDAEQSAHEQRGPADPASPLGAVPGQAFGSGYLLQREIGVGGMGTVWRGWARARRQPVAIKILHPHLSGDRTVVNRFLREGDVLTRLDHPNLVKVHDLVVEGGRLGLVMDLVEGSDLHARRRRRGTLSPAEAARIGAQAAGALAAAHAMGVVHLDLKPANILISEQHSPHSVPEPDVATEADLPNATADIPNADGKVEARLTDFGIARIVDGADQTTTAVTFGTPDYMAPETALDGAATPASDLYALGITLYELVVGRTPYAGGPALTVLARHLERSPRRLPTIPDPLWDVIAACTARNPADRPDADQTAAMLTAAEPALAGIPAAEPLPAGSDYRATSEVRLAGAVAAAIAADALALDPTVAVQQRPAESDGPTQHPEQAPQPAPFPANAAEGTAPTAFAATASAPPTAAAAFAPPAAFFAPPAPAIATPAAEGSAAFAAPATAAAIPAAEGAAAAIDPAIPAAEGTSAVAFAAPAPAGAIPAAEGAAATAPTPAIPAAELAAAAGFAAPAAALAIPAAESAAADAAPAIPAAEGAAVAAFAAPAPAAAIQAAEGVAAAVTAPAPAAAIPAAEGAAAPPVPAVPANAGTSAVAYAAPAAALAIPTAESESRSATESVAPTSLPHAAAASTIPNAAQSPQSTQSPQPARSGQPAQPAQPPQSGQLAQSAHSAPALSESDDTVPPAAEPLALNQATEQSVTHPVPPAMPEPAADFGTAYYAEAAALKPPPKGPFPTASPAPSRHSRFSGRKTADSRSSRRAERGPLMSRRAKRRTALICGPLLLLGVVGGLLVTSGAFASLHGNQHNASEQLPAAAASSRSGPGSGTVNHSHAPVGASDSASPSVQSSASASDGSGTTLSGSGAGATGSGTSGAAGSGSGTSGGSGSSGFSGSGSGGAAAPAPAPPAAVDTGWVCRSGGWKDDGALSVDPCIDYDNGTLYLRGLVKGSYGSSVVIALRVDYGGTYSRTYYSSAFVPESSGTKTQTVTVGSWPSGQDITCEENVDPASDESDYEYGANSADITT